MLGFGRNKELSAAERQKIIERAMDAAKTNGTSSLRVLLARAIGPNESPDGPQVTALISDVTYCGVPSEARKEGAAVWFEKATPEQRMGALKNTFDGLK